MDNIRVSVSTELTKNANELYDYVKAIEKSADLIHFDIMDGKFVDKTTYNCKDVAFIRQITTLPLDVHLMVIKPYKQIKKYVSAGSNIITVHFEAFKTNKQIIKCLDLIRKNDRLAGLSINPDTEIEKIEPLIEHIDLLLLMSVAPGKSGQVFDNKVLNKIIKFNSLKNKQIVEVDGGINPIIAGKLAKTGCDIVASGSYVYNAKNKDKAIKELKNGRPKMEPKKN